jgi:hypothetical protein
MTDISKPGVHEILKADLSEATTKYVELRTQGHAITLDHTFNSAARLEIIRVHHYRTCVVCSGDKHGLTSV